MQYQRVEINGRIWLIPGEKISDLLFWLTENAVDATKQEQKVREGTGTDKKDGKELICESL